MTRSTNGNLIDLLADRDTVRVLLHSVTALAGGNEIPPPNLGMAPYAERALLLARSSDVVCVRTPIDEEYLGFLQACRIGPARERIVVPDCGVLGEDQASVAQLLVRTPDALARLAELVRRAPKIVLEPFIASPWCLELQARLEKLTGKEIRLRGGRPELIERLDNKAIVRQLTERLGLPLLPGRIVAPSPGGGPDFAEIRAASFEYLESASRVVIKGVWGSAASALHVTDTDHLENTLEELHHRSDNSVYIVEEYRPARCSPNIVFVVDQNLGTVSLAGITDQLLDARYAHYGNAYPSQAVTGLAMAASALLFCEELQRRGYDGVVGFDFIECDGPTGDPQPYLMEVNPRVNAACYPLALLERLNQPMLACGAQEIQAIISGRVRTRVHNFGEICALLGALLFNPVERKGIFPYNVGALGHGKLDLASLADSREEAARLLMQAEELLSGTER